MHGLEEGFDAGSAYGMLFGAFNVYRELRGAGVFFHTEVSLVSPLCTGMHARRVVVSGEPVNTSKRGRAPYTEEGFQLKLSLRRSRTRFSKDRDVMMHARPSRSDQVHNPIGRLGFKVDGGENTRFGGCSQVQYSKMLPVDMDPTK